MRIVPLPPKKKRPKPEFPVMSLDNVMDTIFDKCGNVYIYDRHGTGDNKVIILPEPWDELKMMVSYGRRSPMNDLEQKFIGLGHILKDEDENTIIVVSHFMQIPTMNRNPVGASNLGPNGEKNPGLDFLEYYYDEYLKNEFRLNTDAYGYQVDPFLQKCGASIFTINGHTHPGLGVFLSSTDKISGAACAATMPICNLVCDPVRRQILGKIGKGFEDAEIIVMSRKEG